MWFSQLTSRRRRIKNARAPKARLFVEHLEDRNLLSTFLVDRLTDANPTGGGDGSGLVGDLRYAINQANSVAGDDIITFSVTGTMNPAGALPSLSSNIDMQGPGANRLTVRPGHFTVANGAMVILSGLTITGGGSSSGGGGIFNQGTLTLNNVTVSGNSVGDPINGRSGGGIWNYLNATLTVNNSTISGNSALGSSFYGPGRGGGIANDGTLTLNHSTVSGNSANFGSGGGIANAGTLTLNNSTVSGNSANAGAGGITNSGTLNVRNTIIAGNTGGDLSGNLTSQGHNLFGAATGSGFDATDLRNVDPLLGPLQDNGGPTQTMAPLPGSRAVNTGDNAGAPAFDQRGSGFPRIIGGAIDIGAVEAQAPSFIHDFTWALGGITGSTFAWTNTFFTVNRNYTISGAAAPTNFTIGYYRSVDAVFGNADDVLVGTQLLSAAADKTLGEHPGTSPNLQISTPGTYFLFARVEDSNTVAETNETNNVVQAPQQIVVTAPGDLTWTGSGISGPTSATTTTPFTISRNYTINGSAAPSNFTISYYKLLDEDNANPVLIGTETISTDPDKAVGSHPGTSPNLQISTPGTYFIVARVDGSSSIPETNELNNEVESPQRIVVTVGTPTLDLNWSSGGISGPTSAATTEFFTISRNYNISGGAVPTDRNFTITYYRSINATFGDSDDVLLATQTINSDADKTAGPHPGVSPNIRITVAGTYYLFARVDNNNTIPETDETNNVAQALQQIVVSPPAVDLNWTGGGISGPSSATTSTNFTISRNYTISGTAAPSNFTIGYFRSTNSIFGDSDDVLLGSQTISSTADKAVGSHPGTSPSLRITTAGIYYLFARVDNTNTIIETDETNNVAQAPQQIVVTAVLSVSNFIETNSGFTVGFSQPLDPSVLNLYGTQTGSLGPADVTVTTGQGFPLRGSLVVSPAGDAVMFLATGGLLEADTYTVTLRSAANGFRTPGGVLLDGDGNSIPGGDFVTTFTVAPSTDAVVSVPDFARGRGQAVTVPATSSAAGIPLQLSNGAGVTSITLTLLYNPALLSITGATPIAGATANVNTSTPGQAVLTFSSSTPLPSGAIDFVRLTATVPIPAPYGSKHVLDLTDILINNGAIAARDDDGLHISGYFGDTTGSASLSSSDALLAQRVAVGLDSGFDAWQLADPVVIADITGNGLLNSTDALRILQDAVGLDRPEIPPIPPILAPIVLGGPDPLLSIPKNFRVKPGGTITLPVNLDLSDGLQTADLAISYDASRLEVLGVTRGSLTGDFDLFAVNSDVRDGTLRVGLGRSAGPLSGRGSGRVLEITFRVREDAPTGPSIINLRHGVDSTLTQLNEGGLDLIPDPSDEAGDALDGRVAILRRPGKRPLPGRDVDGGLVAALMEKRRFRRQEALTDGPTIAPSSAQVDAFFSKAIG